MICNGAAGKKFLNQSNGIALHLWENEWKIAQDAVAEGRKICSWDIGATTVQRQQESAKIPDGEEKYKLDVVFEATSGNMMTPDNLLKAKELEDFILNHADYPKFCLRTPNTETCQAPSSAIMACVPNSCGILQNSQGLGVQEGCGAQNAAGLTPGLTCDPRKSYHPGVFDCKQPAGCTRAQYETSQAFITKKLDQYSTATFMVDYPESAFLAAVDSSFGAGSETAAAIRSVFTFGFPLEGFTSTGDRKKDQVEKIETFMKDAYFQKLEEWNGEQGDKPTMKIGYSGGALMSDSFSAVLMGDFLKVGLAFVVVGAYMVCMLQSYFLTAMALLQILGCFTTGFMIYRMIFGSFFGSFHIMALFLLLGVGVDDVFVMLDHFEAAALVDPTFQGNLWARISWTWKHATIAMGVTSSTTVIAFVMNATSSFPGIQAFGIFAGALVACLYISMCFYFVSVVCFNWVQFTPKPFCCGVGDAVARMTQREPQEVEDPMLKNEIQKNAMVRFFEHHFSYFILGHRIKILVVFLGLTIYMFVNLLKLKPERQQPAMLPDDHPVQQYMGILQDRFLRGGGEFNTRIHLVYGFDNTMPLDREGTDTTGGGFGEEETIGYGGKVRWNAAMLDVHNVLKSFPCIVQLCNSAELPNQNLNTGGPPAYSMKGCWPRDIQNHIVKTQPSTSIATWALITGGTDEGALEFQKQFNATAAANPRWLEDTHQYLFAEQNTSNPAIPIWRFFKSELKLTSDLNMDFNDGNTLGDNWRAWLQGQLATGSCTTSPIHPFIYSPDFHQFKVVETLIAEMVTSVITSILVALFVLILATGNVFVGLAAGSSIGMIVIWVLAVIPIFGWELGMVENLTLVMVPGLSVDYVAHLAEAYNQAKYDDREHRVIHSLEHSGVSIISGAMSTIAAACCLMICQITFFVKFGTLLLCTIIFSVGFSLFFFPSLMALIGPTGTQGDWHHLLGPCLVKEMVGEKPMRVRTSMGKRESQMAKRESQREPKEGLVKSSINDTE